MYRYVVARRVQIIVPVVVMYSHIVYDNYEINKQAGNN